LEANKAGDVAALSASFPDTVIFQARFSYARMTAA
jgi:hypothetical protein